MTEKHEDADAILASIESQMAFATLEKRAEYAAGVAVLSGDILKIALSSGVPYALAEEMATDFWKTEMLADTIAGLFRHVEEEDE